VLVDSEGLSYARTSSAPEPLAPATCCRRKSGRGNADRRETSRPRAPRLAIASWCCSVFAGSGCVMSAALFTGRTKAKKPLRKRSRRPTRYSGSLPPLRGALDYLQLPLRGSILKSNIRLQSITDARGVISITTPALGEVLRCPSTRSRLRLLKRQVRVTRRTLFRSSDGRIPTLSYWSSGENLTLSKYRHAALYVAGARAAQWRRDGGTSIPMAVSPRPTSRVPPTSRLTED